MGRPDAPALKIHGGDIITYGALASEVEETAETFRARGVRPGDRVMIVCENSAAAVVALLCANRLGAWAVPINARYTAREIDALAAHAAPRLITFTSEVSQEAARHAERWTATCATGGRALPVMMSPTLEAEAEPPAAKVADQVAALMYTTGTTSAPKGVMLTNANLLWNARTSSSVRGFEPGDEVLGVLPISHIFGLSSVLLGTLWSGACCHLMARFDPDAVFDALESRTSIMMVVPQICARLLAHMDGSGRPLRAPHLKYLAAGGAPLDPALKARTERVFGQPLSNGYGLTECSPGIANTRPQQPTTDCSVGTALPGVKVSIHAPDESGIGELFIKSPGLMKGYYRDPEATAAVLMPDGTFRTGDLGRISDDGAITILGRTKELIIRSGFNVYPPEVEAMLTQDPSVKEAAVVGRPADGDEDIIAFVIAPSGDEAEIAARLRNNLAPYKCPTHIIRVPSFPTAPTGKILKHTLLSHFGDLVAVHSASPATPLSLESKP
ncbi:MAG: AMP-binding protein [Pseudomonadota bacterium]